ncbi:MAG: sugar transferase [Planctomycetota bacterium]
MTIKRTFDIVLAVFGIVLAAIPLVLIAFVVRLTSPGPAMHWSRRIGRDNQIFWMPKFRSMRVNTPQLATHLLTGSDRFITPVGKFLRKSSLDELPQLWSILTGSMSFVGPRPALFNQDDLVAARTARGVHRLPPGLTGWAQINGRDELTIPEKVELDAHYLNHRSFALDLKIMFLTAFKVFRSEGVAQAGEERVKGNTTDGVNRTAA